MDNSVKQPKLCHLKASTSRALPPSLPCVPNTPSTSNPTSHQGPHHQHTSSPPKRQLRHSQLSTQAQQVGHQPSWQPTSKISFNTGTQPMRGGAQGLDKHHQPPCFFAAHKKSGGHHPIAIRETLQRWACKCLASQAMEDCSSYLPPMQLGVGIKGGSEAIIHAVASIFENAESPPASKWILQVNFSNAYNNIDRKTLLKEVRTHCPKLSAWVETCYGDPSHLFFGSHTILSSAGGHQGDPLISLFFALVLQPLILCIKEASPHLLLNVWFLDNGTIAGMHKDLLKLFCILKEEGPPPWPLSEPLQISGLVW
jgi:hypothetical protein